MDYVLGSGRHAFTPIGRDDEGVPRELRLTYYASLGAGIARPATRSDRRTGRCSPASRRRSMHYDGV